MIRTLSLALTVFSLLPAPATGVEDTPVSCVFMETCLLPCSFQGGSNAVVHWTWASSLNLPVHSFYHNKDQLGRQDQMYRSRTSLFVDQVSRGNASLQLRGVKVQDQGRYKCFTSTFTGNKESFVILSVSAPVGEVFLQQLEDRIICSSEGIYPQPKLTWSTSTSSNVTLQKLSSVLQSEQLLFSISSSAPRSDQDSDQDSALSCTISSGTSRRTVTLREPASVFASSLQTTIPCSTSHTLESSSHLVWRFNHSQMILTRTRAEASPTISDGWRQQVEGVSESGSLILKDLSQHHEGIYTCEARDAEETLITNTFVKIEKTGSGVTLIFILAVVFVLLVLLVLILIVRKKRSCAQEEKLRIQDQMKLTAGLFPVV